MPTLRFPGMMPVQFLLLFTPTCLGGIALQKTLARHHDVRDEHRSVLNCPRAFTQILQDRRSDGIAWLRGSVE